MNKINHKKKKIVSIDSRTGEKTIWNSIKEASVALDCSQSMISRIISEKECYKYNKTCKGYSFKAYKG